jgi:hypothetical protein
LVYIEVRGLEGFLVAVVIKTCQFLQVSVGCSDVIVMYRNLV